ncbi:MAG: NAD(P)/FAD-dependent oxidoreductase [Inhella sp.]
MKTELSSEARVAIVGAGMAGARCGARLREAGMAVWVVDKARGPGGRLATRRARFVDAQGEERAVAWDHGCPGIEAQDARLQAWLHTQAALGRATLWQPQPGPNEGPATAPPPARWRGTASQPSLCHALLEGAATQWQTTVQALRRDGAAWWLDTNGTSLGPFSAVVLALPPAQAAPLLAPHRLDWARAAALVPMQPCWTWMGVSQAQAAWGDGDWWAPADGPLELVVRQTHRLDGPSAQGLDAWVAHARPGWSREQLESPPEAVAEALQAAVARVLGHPVVWQHSLVHRWRYAQPVLPPAERWGGARWDAHARLGQCGDFLAGHGVDAAWRSGEAVAERIVSQALEPLPPSGRAAGARTERAPLRTP